MLKRIIAVLVSAFLLGFFLPSTGLAVPGGNKWGSGGVKKCDSNRNPATIEYCGV